MTPEGIWEEALAAGKYDNVTLPGSDGASLLTELDEADAFLRDVGLRPDECRGHGIEGGAFPEEMSQPPTAGWQHEPTSSELKALARTYAQREAAEGADAVAVLAAGLRASSSRAARRAAGGDEGDAEA